MFIRTQADMYTRHMEIEWAVKQVAATIVRATPTEDKNWSRDTIREIMELDMDHIPEAKTAPDAEVVNTAVSEEDIERMWAEGAVQAAENNQSKGSLASLRFN